MIVELADGHPFDVEWRVAVLDNAALDDASVRVLACSEATDNVLASAVSHREALWLVGAGVEELTHTARRAGSAGVPAQRVVLEAPLGSVGTLARGGQRVAFCPDAHGGTPGGRLEAEVVMAVASGSRLLRTEFVKQARRSADVTDTLMHERGAGPSGVASDSGAKP